MERYFSWVLQHRLVMLLLVALVTILSLISLSRAVISTSVAELFFGDSPAYATYLEHIQTFGNDEVFVISYEESSPLSVTALDKLQRIRAQIESSPEIARTTSLLTLDRVQSMDGMLKVESYADAARESPDQAQALLDEIQADPLLRQTVISASGTQAVMAIELTVDPSRSGETAPQLVADALEAFQEQGYPAQALHPAGFPAVMAELMAQTRHSMTTLFPIVVLVMVTIVTILFRSPMPVLLSMGVSLLSVVWTLGLAVAMKPTLNIFHGVLPALVTVVGVSDVIHLWSAYLHELRDGQPREQAILLSAVDVGRACLLTSMTTFVGFVSISLIPTPVFQEFGWALGCGVAVALLLAMTLVPIAASFGPAPTAKALRMDNPVAGLVDRLVSISARLSIRHPWSIITLFGLIMAGSALMMSQMTIETNGLERLDEDNQVRMDTSMFQREYAGTSTIDLYLSSDTPGRMLEPDVIRGLARVQTRLQALPTVDKTASVVDLLGRVHQSLGGQGALPNSRAAVAQELLLFELGGGGTLDPLLDFDRGKAHMTLRTSEHRMRALNELGGQAERIAAEELPPDIDVHATGLIAMCGDWLDEIVSGQKLGVFASILSIGLLMVLGLRNLGAGLLSMVPNLLPLMVVAAVCGPIWGDLDSDTLVILMMAIGIGVDDTIHFLTRLRTESLRSTSHTEAIERTFGFAGRAIVMTTIILALGFLPMAMSDYYSMAIMGTLLPLALLVAMSADLLLVPAMAQVGLLRFPNKAA